MGLGRLPKKSAQTLSADADTPAYMTFCYIVGGVISPLLSNILLTDLDLELEKREHKFCRYADDCVPRAQAVA
jgi:hypothetical protein